MANLRSLESYIAAGLLDAHTSASAQIGAVSPLMASHCGGRPFPEKEDGCSDRAEYRDADKDAESKREREREGKTDRERERERARYIYICTHT